MSLYIPYEDIPYNNPVIEEMQFKTLFSSFDNMGEEKRKRKWLYPKRNITIQYNYLNKLDARTIFNFYIARHGSYDAFSFFKYEVETFTGEYIATGDDSTVLFNLPCKNSSARTVYVDSTTQSEGTSAHDYIYTSLGGADGCDKIEFAGAPLSSERITIDFTGNLKIRCRFSEDNLSFETLYNRLRNVGISLVGLLNE